MTMQNLHAFRLRPGMRRGLHTEVPLPTRLVSNEGFPPLPQTAAQRQVEDRILTTAGYLAPRLGLSRRDFLRTSGGMAASLLAMNAVFGRFFDVAEVEAADPAAFMPSALHGSRQRAICMLMVWRSPNHQASSANSGSSAGKTTRS